MRLDAGRLVEGAVDLPVGVCVHGPGHIEGTAICGCLCILTCGSCQRISSVPIGYRGSTRNCLILRLWNRYDLEVVASHARTSIMAI